MAWLLFLVPLLFAAVTLVVPSNRWRPWLVPIGGLTHLGLTAVALIGEPVSALGGWLVLDPLSTLVLTVI